MALRTRIASYFLYLIHGHGHTLWDRLILRILAGAAVLYRIGVCRKYGMYADHPERQIRLKAKVISLGNITVGGTGKTPAACMIAKYFQHQGYETALLNRGYRSQKESATAVMSDGEHILLSPAVGGDEACLMARSLPGIPVLVGRERAKSGALAEQLFHTQILILDDGFQHWQLHRDLDIVLIDATNPFGNGFLLPRGMLREPLEHLQRAGLFMLTKTDQVDQADIDSIYTVLGRYNGTAPVIETVHRPTWCISFADWNSVKENGSCPSLPENTRGIAVSALGNPASFEQTVRSMGYILADTLRYDDHHQYGQADGAVMAKKARENRAVLITTEKDAVKMDAAMIQTYELPLYVLGIELEVRKGSAVLQKVLQQTIGG
ncbi:tetraacyldisaccharide 4'-kinase [uncultured Megasphaera sp.]|uniref:tetraacyldisaccharide 4'-kinase n=1 Tax=uncultured Megasphaera sp. TaxID=165188 RepID=UPI002658F2C0|nr:tetraacyldisaccharide 4'-kinase [uncultured Megasphaera sp.]